MKKIVLFGFLILLLSQYNVFAKQPLNSEELSKQIKKVTGDITSINIKLNESIIEKLNSPTDPKIIMGLKSISSFTAKYRDLLEYEYIIILMYPGIIEGVKLYFSSMLRDNLKQKRKNIGWFMKSFTRFESSIKDNDIILTLAQLRKQIEEAQIVFDQLIIYYSSEYDEYRQDNR